jgi:hypothetical protein
VIEPKINNGIQSFMGDAGVLSTTSSTKTGGSSAKMGNELSNNIDRM